MSSALAPAVIERRLTKYHIRGRTVRTKTTLFLRRKFLSFAVFTEPPSNHIEKHLGYTKHERNAAVVSTFCFVSFLVERHDGGVFPPLVNFPFALDSRDQVVEFPKNGPVLAQPEFRQFRRKVACSHGFRIDYCSGRYRNLCLCWFYSKVGFGSLLRGLSGPSFSAFMFSREWKNLDRVPCLATIARPHRECNPTRSSSFPPPP